MRSDRLLRVMAHGEYVIAGLLGLFFLLAPLLGFRPSTLFMIQYVTVLAIAAMGFDIAAGLGGMLNLTQAAIVGLGAYASAILVVKYGVPVFPAMLIAVVLAVIFGTVMGLPALRLRGWQFVLVTLAFAFVFPQLLFQWRGLTGGFAGLVGIPQPFGARGYYYLVVALGIASFAIASWFAQSRWGRAAMAVRDSAIAAQAVGIRAVPTRLFTLAVSALLGGIAGVLYAHLMQVVSGDNFGLSLAIQLLLIMVLGGQGTITGAVLAAPVVWWLPRVGSGAYSTAVEGAVLLFLVWSAPAGMVGSYRLWAQKRVNARVLKSGQASIADLSTDEPPTPAAAVERVPLLNVDNLVMRFGGNLAVDGVTFTVHTGEVLALLGPNGSGKTTTLNAISGFYAASDGEVSLDGRSLLRRKPFEIARMGVARTFQTPKLLETLSVLDNVALGGSHLGLPAEQVDELARAALGRVGIVGVDDVLVRNVTHPDRRLIEVARALVAAPRVLMLDEPAAGLSGGALKGLFQVVRRLASEGMAIVMVEHNLSFVLEVSDTAVVLESGRMLFKGAPGDIAKDEAVARSYLGAGS